MKSVDPSFYFTIASVVANRGSSIRTHRMGAVGLRSDGAMVVAANGPATNHTPAMHAEARVMRKMDKNGVVFVVRINASGKAMARPCPDCIRTMRSKWVRRVYYTISPDEYGVLEIDPP